MNGRNGWTWKVVEDPEPDPAVETWLDYLSELGKIADTYAFYVGPADGSRVPPPGERRTA
jgi:hypothetical protein